jgi:hypothetical protein
VNKRSDKKKWKEEVNKTSEQNKWTKQVNKTSEQNKWKQVNQCISTMKKDNSIGRIYWTSCINKTKVVVEAWNLLNLVHQYDQGIMELNLVHSPLSTAHNTCKIREKEDYKYPKQ